MSVVSILGMEMLVRSQIVVLLYCIIIDFYFLTHILPLSMALYTLLGKKELKNKDSLAYFLEFLGIHNEGGFTEALR